MSYPRPTRKREEEHKITSENTSPIRHTTLYVSNWENEEQKRKGGSILIKSLRKYSTAVTN